MLAMPTRRLFSAVLPESASFLRRPHAPTPRSCSHRPPAGPLLSRATPLLVLPAWAEEAAEELVQLPEATAAGGPGAAAALVRATGFLLHAAEVQAEAQRGYNPLAVQRATRLARGLALFCAARGWLATARLLLPAMALSSSAAGSNAAAARQAGKGGSDGLYGPLTQAAAAAVAASKAAGPEEQAALRELLQRLAAHEPKGPRKPRPEEREREAQLAGGLQAELRSQLSDWVWAGCNLVAGTVSVLLLLRNFVAADL